MIGLPSKHVGTTHFIARRSNFGKKLLGVKRNDLKLISTMFFDTRVQWVHYGAYVTAHGCMCCSGAKGQFKWLPLGGSDVL